MSVTVTAQYGSCKDTVKQECIPLDSPARWRTALQGIKHAFAHTWENCYAMHLTTGFRTYLYHFESEHARIVCPIAERNCGDYIDIVTPYGFSGFVGNGDCSEFPHYWRQFVRQRGYVCGYIGLNPIFTNRTHVAALDLYQANSVYALDLTLCRDELRARFDRNRKRQLKDWERISAGLIFAKSALTKFFLENYYDFIRRVKASAANYFSIETLAFLCGLDNVFMVGAGERNKIEAVYLFSYTPYAGDCLFNVARPEGRRHTTALLWFGIHHLKTINIPILNLGGGVHEDDSVARSKQRFGARRVPFSCLKQVYEPAIYETLCHQMDADPQDRDGYFPSYRNPQGHI